MVIDFHSHILPGIDDGSRSVAESLAMLRTAQAQGIQRIVLTPHFYPQRTTPEQFLAQRSQAFEQLRSAMDPGEGLPQLCLGAEVYFYPHMSHSDALAQLRIEGTDCILVEMPTGAWTDRMYRELEAIPHNLGLTPIVAHVDRYLGRFRDYGIPDRLAELPVLVQANASFFLSRTSEAKAMRMLRRKQIHLLGSDCHNTADRAPNLGPALAQIRRRLGDDAIAWINENESDIFAAGEGLL